MKLYVSGKTTKAVLRALREGHFEGAVEAVFADRPEATRDEAVDTVQDIEASQKVLPVAPARLPEWAGGDPWVMHGDPGEDTSPRLFDIKERWAQAYRNVWKHEDSPVTVAAIVTNTRGSGNVSDDTVAPGVFVLGTPVLGSIGNGTVILKAEGGVQFLVDHKAQTVTALVGTGSRAQEYELPPLTDEQKAFFGVDFGGQFSS